MADQRRLIRNGYVITLDQTIGDLWSGDVLIEGSKIVEVGPSIEATDCEVIDATGMVVLPGFVDTHRHTWQASVRGIATDWTLADYFHGLRGILGKYYRPEDVYAANLLGRLEALDSGITTMLDWSHIMNTPEHADAAVAALKDAGARAIFAYGNSNDAWLPGNNLRHSDDAWRIQREYFSSSEQLVTFALALRGPQFATMEATVHDWQLARELGARITVHVGDGEWGLKYHPIERLNERGLLGPDTTYVHCNTLSEHELQLIADTGGTASIAPEVEMHMGHGFPATGRLLAHGIRPSLSIDVVTNIGGDMFGVMRATLAMERALVNDRALREDRPIERLEITTRDVLQFATIDGARACALDHKIGTLAPGKEADILLLRTDRLNLAPLNNPVGGVVLAANPANVDTVLVAGVPVKRNGQFTGIDLASVLKRATASRDYLLGQSGLRVGFDWRLDTQAEWQA